MKCEAGGESAGLGAAQTLPGCRPVQAYDDIIPGYRGTAIADLFAYHNLGAPLREHARPELLIGTCMDYRISLRMPPDFAYLIRVGGANLRGLDFHVSVAVAFGGVRAICLIGHDECAMVGVAERQDAFVRGLVENGGWCRRDARSQFLAHAPHLEIGEVAGFVRSEAVRLSWRYPRVVVAPLHYAVGERLLYRSSGEAPRRQKGGLRHE